jgi:adenine-specific DNA-methyltransferase
MSPPASAAALAPTSPRLSDDKKRELGQFFTPAPLAEFIASFFTRSLRDWRVIDAGAGSGRLIEALLRHVLRQRPVPVSFHVTAYEIDATALPLLRDALERCGRLCDAHDVVFSHEIRAEDFIVDTTAALDQSLLAPPLRTFNAAIVNPPYRKLAIGSPTHRQLAAIGIDVTNLYSGFLSLLARVLESNSELVAIVPRSFCNGPYFRSFRRDFLGRMALRRLHVFESRSAAFAAESVLQENIILRAERSATVPTSVEISSSRGDLTDSARSRLLPWGSIVQPKDPHAFIRLPASDHEQASVASLTNITGSLTNLGLKVSTGKVVDFRAREHLRRNPEPEAHPLLYPCHFERGALAWPKLGGKKPNALAVSLDRTDLLVPVATYVVVRRFSAKEERRRIVASLLDPHGLPPSTVAIGIENHLNYFHADGDGLDPVLARGLYAYLNWNVVDGFFRHFNGHTQVNATDLRSLPYPTATQLRALGHQVAQHLPSPSHDELDALVASHLVP